jgi:metal-dependent amidase/aminoacylase/carboxypeptidase family protein
MKTKFTLSLFLTIAIIFSPSITNAQQKSNEGKIHESIKIDTDKIFEKIVKVRRDFHQYPELAGQEKKTQEVIKKYLLDLGLQVETDFYGYGVVGILKGAKKGKTIAWRADMDALPNDLPDYVDFESKLKGAQHGCGHDVHMAIGLGIAEVLAKNKKSLQGTVYFIFQPEEETFIGAKKMIENGVFSKIKPDEIYGLHVAAFPVGQVIAKPNEIFAYQKRVKIELKNTLLKDEIDGLVKKLNNSFIRAQAGAKPWEIQNYIDPKIGISNTNTIFKDYFINEGFSSRTKNETLSIAGNVYETNATNLQNILPMAKTLIESSGLKDKLLSVSFSMENPTVINDPQLISNAMKILDGIYGKGFVTPTYGQVPFFNDDFAYFQQKTPGVYFILGGSNFEKGLIAMNHAPNFRVDEECLRVGVRTFSSLIVERLK